MPLGMSKNENENFQKNPNQHSGYVWFGLFLSKAMEDKVVTKDAIFQAGIYINVQFES